METLVKNRQLRTSTAQARNGASEFGPEVLILQNETKSKFTQILRIRLTAWGLAARGWAEMCHLRGWKSRIFVPLGVVLAEQERDKAGSRLQFRSARNRHTVSQ